jgi:poly(hydroxyalkanoate) granule-associated protein
MAKKAAKKKKKAPATFKDRAHKVWLAGLGALAVAEAEGSKLFHQLADKGADLEKRGKPVVDKMVKEATDKVSDVGKKAKARAQKVGGKVGDEAKSVRSKMEGALDDGVAAALHRLGIPTRKEIEDLTKRVEALTAKLDGKKPARRKATRKPAAKKTARKPAKKTARKPAAKKTVRKPAAKKAARKPAAKKTTAPAAGA